MCLKGFCWNLWTATTKVRYKMENVILFVCFAWSTEDGGTDCCFRRTKSFFFYSGAYCFVNTVIKSIRIFFFFLCMYDADSCSKDTAYVHRYINYITKENVGNGCCTVWGERLVSPLGALWCLSWWQDTELHFILFLCTWLAWKGKQDELSSLKYRLSY